MINKILVWVLERLAPDVLPDDDLEEAIIEDIEELRERLSKVESRLSKAEASLRALGFGEK